MEAFIYGGYSSLIWMKTAKRIPITAKQFHADRLQRWKNNAARIISKRREFDHFSPVLKELRWLPVEHSISYKRMLLACKTLNGHAHKSTAICTTMALPFGPRRMNISIHQDGGLKRLESELSPISPFLQSILIACVGPWTAHIGHYTALLDIVSRHLYEISAI